MFASQIRLSISSDTFALKYSGRRLNDVAKTHMFSSFFCCLAFLVVTFFFVLAGTANSANLTLAWDANSEPDLTGYLVFCGESSGQLYPSLRRSPATTLVNHPRPPANLPVWKRGQHIILPPWLSVTTAKAIIPRKSAILFQRQRSIRKI